MFAAAAQHLLRMMQEEKKGESSVVSRTSKPTEQSKKKRVKVVSAPPAQRKRPVTAMVIGALVIALLAFIFLPQQLNNGTLENEANHNVQADGVYDVIDMVSEQQWRESCATTMNNGVVIVQRSNGEAQACINRDRTVEVDDFSAEWAFDVDRGKALFLVGQNAQHYRVSLDRNAEELTLTIVEKDGASMTDLQILPIALYVDRPNTIEVTRRDAEIVFAFNGDVLLTTDDALYSGEPTELWLGVGGEAAPESTTTITYQSILLTE